MMPGAGRREVSFFFFQAEDGIRDVAVTGVQTCALPIYQRVGFFWFASKGTGCASAARYGRRGTKKDVSRCSQLRPPDPDGALLLQAPLGIPQTPPGRSARLRLAHPTFPPP